MGEGRFEGSMLITSDGFYPWEISAKEEISIDNLLPVIEASGVEIVIIGMGERMAFLSKEIRAAFQAKNINVEAMDTGAAARTYNVLLQEGRKVSAALIAI
jgi:uncharacterized protein